MPQSESIHISASSLSEARASIEALKATRHAGITITVVSIDMNHDDEDDYEENDGRVNDAVFVELLDAVSAFPLQRLTVSNEDSLPIPIQALSRALQRTRETLTCLDVGPSLSGSYKDLQELSTCLRLNGHAAFTNLRILKIRAHHPMPLQPPSSGGEWSILELLSAIITAGCPNLSTLNLHNLDHTPAGHNTVLSCLSYLCLSSLHNLNFMDCHMGGTDLARLLSLLHDTLHNIQILHLDIRLCHDKDTLELSSKHLEAIAAMAGTLPSVTSLSLPAYFGGPNFITPLTMALKHNTQLQSLYLYRGKDEHIVRRPREEEGEDYDDDDDAAKLEDALCDMMIDNYTLTSLAYENYKWKRPDILFYNRLNHAGRKRLLQQQSTTMSPPTAGGDNTAATAAGAAQQRHQDWLDAIIKYREVDSVVFYLLSENPCILADLSN